MKKEKVYLTKEETIKVAMIKGNKIHCFVNPSFGLIGADWSKKEFEETLDIAQSIEVGGEMCRKMKHAIAVTKRNDIFFFEHNEEKLRNLLKIKGLE